jgi:hypothetical protein
MDCIEESSSGGVDYHGQAMSRVVSCRVCCALVVLCCVLVAVFVVVVVLACVVLCCLGLRCRVFAFSFCLFHVGRQELVTMHMEGQVFLC